MELALFKKSKEFPTRDYNHAIIVPDYVLTPNMAAFVNKLVKSLTEKCEPTVDTLEADLEDVRGLLNTKEKLVEIRAYFLNEVLNDPKYQKIDSTLGDFIEELDKAEEDEQEDE